MNEWWLWSIAFEEFLFDVSLVKCQISPCSVYIRHYISRYLLYNRSRHKCKKTVRRVWVFILYTKMYCNHWIKTWVSCTTPVVDVILIVTVVNLWSGENSGRRQSKNIRTTEYHSWRRSHYAEEWGVYRCTFVVSDHVERFGPKRSKEESCSVLRRRWQNEMADGQDGE